MDPRNLLILWVGFANLNPWFKWTWDWYGRWIASGVTGAQT